MALLSDPHEKKAKMALVVLRYNGASVALLPKNLRRNGLLVLLSDPHEKKAKMVLVSLCYTGANVALFHQRTKEEMDCRHCCQILMKRML
jgi:hypothetical protein